ncbi:unnamed protein product [Withania somnifera]
MASAKIFLIFFFAALVANPVAVAQLGPLNGLLDLIHLDGVLYCSLNGKSDVINGISTPIFPMSSTTTNGLGVFSLVLDPIQNILSSLPSNRNLVVTTPLSTCNATLPSVGVLRSPLRFVGKTLVGVLSLSI